MSLLLFFFYRCLRCCLSFSMLGLLSLPTKCFATTYWRHRWFGFGVRHSGMYCQCNGVGVSEKWWRWYLEGGQRYFFWWTFFFKKIYKIILKTQSFYIFFLQVFSVLVSYHQTTIHIFSQPLSVLDVEVVCCYFCYSNRDNIDDDDDVEMNLCTVNAVATGERGAGL
jgi:hypothetical protein